MSLINDFLITPNISAIQLIDESKKEVKSFLDKQLDYPAFLKKYICEVKFNPRGQYALPIDDFTVRRAIETYPEVMKSVFEKNEIEDIVIHSAAEKEVIKGMKEHDDTKNQLQGAILSVLDDNEVEAFKNSNKILGFVSAASGFYTPEGAQYVHRIIGGVSFKYVFANVIFVIGSAFRFIIDEYLALSKIRFEHLTATRSICEARLKKMLEYREIGKNFNGRYSNSEEANTTLRILTEVWQKVLNDNEIKDIKLLDRISVSELSLNMVTAISKSMCATKSEFSEDERKKIVDNFANIVIRHCPKAKSIWRFWEYVGFSEYQERNKVNIGYKTFYNIVKSSVARVERYGETEVERNREAYRRNIDYISHTLTFQNKFVQHDAWKVIYNMHHERKTEEDWSKKSLRDSVPDSSKRARVKNEQLSEVMTLSSQAIVTHAGLERFVLFMKLLKVVRDFAAYFTNNFLSKTIIAKLTQSAFMLSLSNLVGFKYISNFFNKMIEYFKNRINVSNQKYNDLYCKFNVNVKKIFESGYAMPDIDAADPDKINNIEIDTRANTYFTLISKTILYSLENREFELLNLEKRDLAAVTMILFNACHPFMVQEAEKTLVCSFTEDGVEKIARSISMNISAVLTKMRSGKITLNCDFEQLYEQCYLPLKSYLEKNKEIIEGRNDIAPSPELGVKDVLNKRIAKQKQLAGIMKAQKPSRLSAHSIEGVYKPGNSPVTPRHAM